MKATLKLQEVVEGIKTLKVALDDDLNLMEGEIEGCDDFSSEDIYDCDGWALCFELDTHKMLGFGFESCDGVRTLEKTYCCLIVDGCAEDTIDFEVEIEK